MFSLLFNICEVIIGNTLFWSKNKRKFSSCGMSLFFDLIWSCKNGGVCYKHFDNIPNFDDGNSHFIEASGVKSQTDKNGEGSDAAGRPRGSFSVFRPNKFHAPVGQ